MSVIQWDTAGSHYYETGVDHGVLYVASTERPGTYESGKAWNGLSNVSESPDGAESNPIYADNIKYLDILSAEEYGFTIEAYTYPDEWAECDGSAEVVAGSGVSIRQQKRKAFAFSWRTKIGNDVDDDLGYKIHIAYGGRAAPSDVDHETVNDSPEAATFSWEVSTTPVAVPGFKPTAKLEIDSRKIPPAKLKAIEDKLYGTADSEPTLLMPEEIIAILQAN